MTSPRDTLEMRAREAAAPDAVAIWEKFRGLTQVKDFSAGGVIIVKYGDNGVTGKAASRSRITGRSQLCAR